MRSVRLVGGNLPEWARLYDSLRAAAEPRGRKESHSKSARKVKETISIPAEYALLLRSVAEVRTHVRVGKHTRSVGRPSLGAVVAALVKAHLPELEAEAGAYLARQRESIEILLQREEAKREHDAAPMGG
jgi:hypothetical protein